jgi:hypothetical protein
MAQLVEGARFGGPTRAHDGDPVAQRLDLGEDVAGQQDGPASLAQFPHHILEHLLHQRVQAGARLVEQVELHPLE